MSNGKLIISQSDPFDIQLIYFIVTTIKTNHSIKNRIKTNHGIKNELKTNQIISAFFYYDKITSLIIMH